MKFNWIQLSFDFIKIILWQKLTLVLPKDVSQVHLLQLKFGFEFSHFTICVLLYLSDHVQFTS